MAKYNVATYNSIYIYAINDGNHNGLLKIGEASFSSVESIAQLTPNCARLKTAACNRIDQQTKTAMVSYDLLYVELAVKTITMQDGSKQIQQFSDHDVRELIMNSGYKIVKFAESGRFSEWCEVDLETAKKAIQCVKEGKAYIPTNATVIAHPPTLPVIKLRKEQDENVCYTMAMFNKYDRMLWDCKMRYGKTVTAYELIKRQGYKKVIVITHRPAVADSWSSDHKLMFNGTPNEFIVKINSSQTFDEAMDADNDRNLKEKVANGTPFVYFTSIQDLRLSERVGGKYNKNNAVFDIDWDLLIVDEAHEGTLTELGEALVNGLKKPTTKLLLLSGTPYNILSDFEENKYTWTYVDEQKAKENWGIEHPDEKNPYEELPKMNIYTFDISDKIPASYRYVTEDSAFNFHEFFRTWTGDISKDYYPIPVGYEVGDFVHKEDVKNFLDLISTDSDDSNYPFSTDEYRDMFAHTFWIVPGVKEARALSAMLNDHDRFKEFEIVNIAGDGDEEKPYDEALSLVKNTIKHFDKTITISCGKLTTGVTVREWTGVMMLSGSSSTAAAGYMQAIFRVQSPGCINGKQKKNCYVFDFAPDRTLKVIAEVHRITHKGTQGGNKEKQALGEFINFCPIISVEGTVMRTYDVSEMMRQIKRISVEAAINSGFDDDTIYVSDAGINMTDVDAKILQKLSDVVVPQRKGKKQTEVTITDTGMTDEQRKVAERAKRKPKKELTPEEKEALELLKKQKEEQKKVFNLLRAVSIRLPLLFYGADADITEIIHLKDFVELVDEESWEEFMPRGLKPSLFLDILKYYDEDIVVGAGLRIRKMAKAADELPPTFRAKRIVEIITKFKNPDKETVLTPWRVVNMHMGTTLGGYNFYDEAFKGELEEPRLIENGEITANILLNPEAKILELNSKSGLYPLYMAYSLYMIKVSGKEKDLSFDEAQQLWNETLANNIFVLCKTKMARTITIRTLAGYTGTKVNAIHLTKLVDERMKDIPRLSKKLTNPASWGLGGERMKFDAVVGNPPYQGNNHQQIYPYFYLSARDVTSRYVSMIFPTGWQEPKNANNLAKLNNPEIKQDKQIVSIDNRQNVFPGIAGAEWVNIILWEKGYDNGLDGVQLIYTNGENPEEVELPLEVSAIVKPKEIVELGNIVTNSFDFTSVMDNVSTNKPYGLRKNIIDNYDYYNLPEMHSQKTSEDDLVLYASNERIMYCPCDYPLPKVSLALNKYKVFVPSAWGNMSEKTGLGGAYSDIIIGCPNDICTETFIECGNFGTFRDAKCFAKYAMTKFVRALIYVHKFSQQSSRSVWAAVPVQNFAEEWWDKSIAEIDEELFKKYNLPEDVADFIRKNIQTKDETNIVNFK